MLADIGEIIKNGRGAKALPDAPTTAWSAFNAITARLDKNAHEAEVISAIDGLLDRYGGTGAYGRADHLSHAFIDAELNQLRTMSRIVPPIFFAVAAFLINMALARLITREREQIGLLKAIGYSSTAIVLHYLKFVSVIAAVGVLAGFGAGIWLGVQARIGQVILSGQ